MMEVRELEDDHELVITVLLAHQSGVTTEDITCLHTQRDALEWLITRWGRLTILAAW